MTKVAMFGLATIASLALVACGGGGSSSSTSSTTSAAAPPAGGGGSSGGGASSAVKLAADPSQIAYDTDSLSAKAGNVTIDFNNPNSALGHDVCVEVEGGSELGCSDVVTGDSTSLDLKNVKPGTYKFFCSVDAHEQAGMEGTLNVQ
jgi:plastocyanin